MIKFLKKFMAIKAIWAKIYLINYLFTKYIW